MKKKRLSAWKYLSVFCAIMLAGCGGSQASSGPAGSAQAGGAQSGDAAASTAVSAENVESAQGDTGGMTEEAAAGSAAAEADSGKTENQASDGTTEEKDSAAESASLENETTPSDSTSSKNETSPSAAASGNGASQSKGSFDTSTTIEEQVLYDAEGLTIKATGLTYESYRAVLGFSFENTSDKDYEIIAGSLGYSANSVNGWMVPDGYIVEDIPAGKKSNKKVYFDLDLLEAYGIHRIETMQMAFTIEEDGNWESEFRTGPLDIRTSAGELTEETAPAKDLFLSLAERYSGRADLLYTGEEEVYAKEGIRIVGEGYLVNSDGDHVLYLDAVNESDAPVMIGTEDISANDMMLCSGRWDNESINPGKRALIELNLTSMADEDWEYMGISAVTDVELDILQINDEHEEVTEAETIHVQFPGEGGVDFTGEELYHDHGVTILSKGLYPDRYGDINWKLLIINENDFEIQVGDGWGDALSMDDYMIDYVMWGAYVPGGKASLADIEIDEDSLEEADLDIDQIGKAEISLEIRDMDYNDIANPTITASFGG